MSRQTLKKPAGQHIIEHEIHHRHYDYQRYWLFVYEDAIVRCQDVQSIYDEGFRATKLKYTV